MYPLGEILQVKSSRNILIVAAQESGTHPLDFTETTQRHELTSASAKSNKGVSRGFNPFLSYAAAVE